MKVKVLLILLLFFHLSSVAVAETQTVSVDAGFNCCTRDYYKSCAVKVHLSPGRYVFRPVDGALSRWGDDYTAHAQGTQPWEWHVWINDGSQQKPWSLGSLVRYKTKSEALQRQQNQRVNITLRQQSTIFIWTEDEYQGKEYCTDNRGELVLEIKKVD